MCVHGCVCLDGNRSSFLVLPFCLRLRSRLLTRDSDERSRNTNVKIVECVCLTALSLSSLLPLRSFCSFSRVFAPPVCLESQRRTAESESCSENGFRGGGRCMSGGRESEEDPVNNGTRECKGRREKNGKTEEQRQKRTQKDQRSQLKWEMVLTQRGCGACAVGRRSTVGPTSSEGARQREREASKEGRKGMCSRKNVILSLSCLLCSGSPLATGGRERE